MLRVPRLCAWKRAGAGSSGLCGLPVLASACGGGGGGGGAQLPRKGSSCLCLLLVLPPQNSESHISLGILPAGRARWACTADVSAWPCGTFLKVRLAFVIMCRTFPTDLPASFLVVFGSLCCGSTTPLLPAPHYFCCLQGRLCGCAVCSPRSLCLQGPGFGVMVCCCCRKISDFEPGALWLHSAQGLQITLPALVAPMPLVAHICNPGVSPASLLPCIQSHCTFQAPASLL